jgi:hypothetical protein
VKRCCCIFLILFLTIGGGQARVASSPVAERQSEQVAAEIWARENHRAILDLVLQSGCLTSMGGLHTQ